MSLEHHEKSNRYSDIEEILEDDIEKAMRMKKALAVKSPYFRECLAEFIGTMVLVMFGDGVVAQTVLSEGMNGNNTNINICWGLAVLFGIHFSGGVSGAHLNPAVTVTLAIFKGFEWRKIPGYVLAQMLGAFVAAAIIFFVYYPHFDAIDPQRNTTMSIFATYPNAKISNWTAVLTEVVGTALLLGGIFAISDQKNKPASPYSGPSAVALLIVAIGMAFGMNSGYAINPARDFGPRLFTMIAGWGTKVLTMNDYYFFVPLFAPLIGGPLGGGLYVLAVENHHPEDTTDVDEIIVSRRQGDF